MSPGKPDAGAPISKVSPVYRARKSEVIWAEWEGICTLYHRPTGDTHILSQLPWETLRLLLEEDLSAEAIAERLARECGITADEDWRTKTEQAIDSLHNLRLLEKLPPIPTS